MVKGASRPDRSTAPNSVSRDCVGLRILVVDDYADVAQSTGPSWTASDVSLFEPLRRRSGADSQGERESLGLGLFIVSQIALAHGGGVTVESAEGRTRFTVRLPKR